MKAIQIACQRIKTKKWDNRGAAIVSVVVITAFISVIATTLLYISGQNYQQKQIDYQNKDTFYQAEVALDSLKSLLVKQAGEAYLAAYQDTMQNYARLGTDEARNSYFNKKFVDKLVELWDEINSKSDLKTSVQVYMKENGVSDSIAEQIYEAENYGVNADGQFVIKGVKAKYTTSTNTYSTFLYTDFGINVPAYDNTFSPSISGDGDVEDSIVSLSDCVVYMNWCKTDYYGEDDDDV